MICVSGTSYLRCWQLHQPQWPHCLAVHSTGAALLSSLWNTLFCQTGSWVWGWWWLHLWTDLLDTEWHQQDYYHFFGYTINHIYLQSRSKQCYNELITWKRKALVLLGRKLFTKTSHIVMDIYPHLISEKKLASETIPTYPLACKG